MARAPARRPKKELTEVEPFTAHIIDEDGEEDRMAINLMVGLTDSGKVRFGLCRHDGMGTIFVDLSPESAADVMQALSDTIETAKKVVEMGGFLHPVGSA